MDWMDDEVESREAAIFRPSLLNREECLERNMFPYQMPPGCEHWTFWRRQEIRDEWVCEYIQKWLRENRGKSSGSRKPVVSWNFDNNNARRTIDIHLSQYGTDNQDQ